MQQRTWLMALCVGVVAIAGCASDDDRTASSPPTSTSAAPRTPTVASAILEGPVTVGEPSGPADPRPVELETIGYLQEEYFATGTATSFSTEGELDPDGKWTATPEETASYRTRLVGRRPKDAAAFSGTVVVEWLNVTVVEAAPEWAYTASAIVDAGAAWVGVSVQALGVVGGASALDSGDARQADASGGLVTNDPERYGSLVHPGDEFSFDIYSQIGAALRAPGDVPVLGEAAADHVIAAGESQSAYFVTTYINAIQPSSDVFDGFFVHSRGAGAARLDGASAIGRSGPFRIRTDLDVPVLQFETESDVGPLLRFGAARQPDHRLLRTWEVAGTAHADAFLVGSDYSACPQRINDGPQHYVTAAAMTSLIAWVEDGTAPPKGAPIATAADGTDITRDEDGIALGGIRTPSVEVPVAVLSGGSVPGTPTFCALFGTSTPFDAATLHARYGTMVAYLEAFDTALDEAISAGFVRRTDRAEYAAEARAVVFPGEG